ncbi:hypothetical protein DIPPA_00940 [Diplonema papillatum]|nr:hypothetical protein DIPPA_00940 [Diplonema papillatum]
MAVSLSDFKEILQLLPNERPDVRKEVLGVLAQCLQSAEVLDWFIENGAEDVKAITEMLRPGKAVQGYLGNVLALLINLSDKGACSRAMLEARVMPRTMLLLEKGAMPPALQELSLMLLANLTSVSVDAVDALLQTTEGTLEGYYLSQLVRRFVDDHIDKSKLIVAPSDEDLAGGGRDRSKWVGSVLGNCAQCKAGRRLLIEDTVGLEKFVELLSSGDVQLRYAVTCILKNILHDPETHEQLVAAGAGTALLLRVIGDLEDDEIDPATQAVTNERPRKPLERVEDILNVAASAVRCLSLSKLGVAFLDGVGAKAKLARSMEAIAEHSEARATLQTVLQSLDEVQEIHVMTGPTADEKMLHKQKVAEAAKAERRERHKLPPGPAGEESGVVELDSDDDVDLPVPPQDDVVEQAEKEMEAIV